MDESESLAKFAWVYFLRGRPRDDPKRGIGAIIGSMVAGRIISKVDCRLWMGQGALALGLSMFMVGAISQCRLRHKRYPFCHGGPLANYILNPRVRDASAGLLPCRSFFCRPLQAFPSLPNEKYATTYFSVRSSARSSINPKTQEKSDFVNANRRSVRDDDRRIGQ
jgi:hypothetical protein